MATTTEIAARIAELKISTGTHEHAGTWIRAAIHELEIALGWAEHLERIEAANPGRESAERDNANRWIADHTDRGERIAREAGAHLPVEVITADWSKCTPVRGGDVHVANNVHMGARVLITPTCESTRGPGYTPTTLDVTCPTCIQSVIEHAPRRRLN